MDETPMELELMAQRDVAKLMVAELRAEVEAYRARVRTMERRLELSETKRVQGAAVARRAKAALAAREAATHHEILLLLVGGVVGGFFGWCIGLLVIIFDGPPTMAFLVMGPSLAGGVLLGVGALVAHRKRREWLQETAAVSRSTKHLRPLPASSREVPFWRSAIESALILTRSLVSYLHGG
ncbi:hypothetical protein ACHHYP_08398 [Achlya hypogyna]|uniref:Transmembrane protein n=1 Tax=Achlya hypogyna TaxID=1202772 RepID=A0A1V9YPP4_ACHHY|nr:hypothetical protein ACHHYP_08398 [Achlya hypogyna]